ncbi:hypothetical protein GW7_02328 [Heterocephalus glaber]|uniref:Uncharacterized protein n=1 Tax=Heterocephalus glaber TaxID=10181 RepID=G5BDU4_HETGA|nr:hypothetical protein GW7_02328 [Heterocephalus glaber]
MKTLFPWLLPLSPRQSLLWPPCVLQGAQEVKQGQETWSLDREDAISPSIAACSWTPKMKKATAGFGGPQHPQRDQPQQDAPGQQQLPEHSEMSIPKRASLETLYQERPKEKPCQAGPPQVNPRPWSPSHLQGDARVPGQESWPRNITAI